MNKFGGITAAELHEIGKELKIDIKALLCSSKQGLSEFELKKEYRVQFGKDIPYISLGFNNIYELMRSMPDVCYAMKHYSGNMWIYYAVIDESLQDLARMVKGQKSDKTVIKREQLRSQYRSNNPYSSNTSQYSRQNQTSRYSNGNAASNYARTIPAELQQQIKSLLTNAVDNKLSLADFDNEYKLKYSTKLDSFQYGFSSMRQMFESLSHLVFIETHNGRSDGSDFVCLIRSSSDSSSNDVLVNNKSSTILNVADKPIVEQKKHLITLEEEIITNITNLIKNIPKKSIELSDLTILYQQYTKKPLDFDKLGFTNVTDLIKNLSLPNIRIKLSSTNYENRLVYDETPCKRISVNHDDSLDSDNKEDDNIIKLKNLKPYIQNAFRNQRHATLNEFLHYFDRRNGWKLDFRDYGLQNYDQLFAQLVSFNLLNAELGQDNKAVFNCDHLFAEKIECIPKEIVQPEIDFNSLNKTEQLKRAKYNLEFIQDYILYKTDLTNEEILRKLATQKEHKIIISNVTNPCFIEIQLAENANKLEKLMDELEMKYTGFGASDFDMPEEYMLTHHLCAAVYSVDNNWHRCRIVDSTKEWVQVYFIDYGGESWVSRDKIKFLYNGFNMPCQAVKAKFANIKFNPKWNKEEQKTKVINYLLKKVMSKQLTATIVGFNEGLLSLEIIDHTTTSNNGCQAGTPISLNKRIVMDGIGEMYDEKKDLDFKNYERWKNEILNSPPVIKEKLKEDIVAKFEKALSNYETSRDHSTFSENIKQTAVDHNNNNDSQLSSTKSAQPDSLTRKSQRKKSTKTVQTFKTKENIYFEPNYKKTYKLNIILMNKSIYVHWAQVAVLFGLGKRIFKDRLTSLRKTELEDSYLEVFMFNEENEQLFDTVHNDFKINLEDLNELSELYMLKFYSLYDIANDFLDEEYSKNLQNFIINNKVSGNDVSPELLYVYQNYLNENGGSEQSFKSSKGSKTDLSICNKMNSLNLDSSNMTYAYEINRLKTELLYYENVKETQKINEIENKITFYENLLVKQQN